MKEILTAGLPQWGIDTACIPAMERFSALLTDAIRAEVLENAGYRVDCLEFVGLDASPKNLMLRAVKADFPAEDNSEIERLLKKYGVRQTLLQLQREGGPLDKQEVENG